MASHLTRLRNSARLHCDDLESRVTPTNIDFGTGFIPAQMPGGLASGYADGDLLLTDGPYQANAVLAPTALDVRAFETSFVFRLDGEPGKMGDGFTFAIAGSASPTAGTAGGGLGYQGITDSVAIKFDLVNNAGEGANSVGLFTGGASPTTSAINLDGTGINLHSGNPIRADIHYDGSELSLALTDTTDPNHSWTHDFAVEIPRTVRSQTAFVGFTAGTGALFARQAIESWTFTELPSEAPENQPPEISLPISVHFVGPGTVGLTAKFTDDGGTNGLTPTWEKVSTPNGASPEISEFYSSPGSSLAFAKVDLSGRYTFRFAVQDAQGLVAFREVSYSPLVFVTAFEVSPRVATITAGETIQFLTTVRNETGNPHPDHLTPLWEVVSGPGTIDEAGLYTAPPDATGPVTIGAKTASFDGTHIDWIGAQSTLFVRPAGEVDFGQGFTDANLIQNGSAQTVGNRLRLADAPYQAGSAYSPIPVDVRGFDTSFRFQIGDEPSWWHGDGLTFVLQNAGPAALGKAGGGLGFQGIGQGVAVKFDLVNNVGEGTDSVGVFTGEVEPTVPSDKLSQGPFATRMHLNSGHVFQVNLHYRDGKLTLVLQDTVTGGWMFYKTYDVNIPAAVGGTTAFAGFTAGTGQLFAPIDILDWTYSAEAADQPPEITSLTSEFGGSPGWISLQAEVGDESESAGLTYTWEVVSVPAGAVAHIPTPDSVGTTTVFVSKGGMFTFRVIVQDQEGRAAFREVTFDYPVNIRSLEVSPQLGTVRAGETVQFQSIVRDEFGNVLTSVNPLWQLMKGPGSIDPSGRYTAPADISGFVTIRAVMVIGPARQPTTLSSEATVQILSTRPPDPGLDFGSGFATPDMIQNGSAEVTGGRLRLTDAANEAGSAYAPGPVDVRGFVTRFRMQIPDALSLLSGDGLTFVIQNAGSAALGAAGGGLGYEGITNSVAVKFDLQDNAGEGTNSIGIFTGGVVPTVPAQSLPAGTVDLGSGHVVQIDITYIAGLLNLFLRDTETGATWGRSNVVDIPAAVGASSAYVGFTAGTGAAYAPIEILDWKYVPTDNWDPQPFPA